MRVFIYSMNYLTDARGQLSKVTFRVLALALVVSLGSALALAELWSSAPVSALTESGSSVLVSALVEPWDFALVLAESWVSHS
jgi:hypothetical protein